MTDVYLYEYIVSLEASYFYVINIVRLTELNVQPTHVNFSRKALLVSSYTGAHIHELSDVSRF